MSSEEPFSAQINKLAGKTKKALASTTGKNVTLYLLCLLVAFGFWLLMSLDTELQRDYDIPLEIENVPDSVTLLSEPPRMVSVTVKGKGSQLLRFNWGKLSTLRLQYDETMTEDGVVALSHMKLDSRLRDYFGNTLQILSMRPDSIYVPLTTEPGVSVKLNVIADVHPNLQSIISGPVMANVDSVKLYSANAIPRSLKSVDTEPIVRDNLKDTTRYEVKVKPIPGVRIIPDKVIVTVPVEPLISKRRHVIVEALNEPEDENVITFPLNVEVSYLVPISAYNDEYPIKVFVDYNEILRASSNSKVALHLSVSHSLYQNLSVKPDSVEYIIEKFGRE